MLLNSEIITTRFVLRPLQVGDASLEYLSWLSEPNTSEFITEKNNYDMKKLEQYISGKIDRDDILFLGIFDKESLTHIGNIKYEPVNSDLGYAVMGIMIGNYKWRGIGVAAEVIIGTSNWLLLNRGIKRIMLGVSLSNINAIRAYKKIGFVENIDKKIITEKNTMLMVLYLR
jgi:RimJ/RimL family protein N-acetyltransferase